MTAAFIYISNDVIYIVKDQDDNMINIVGIKWYCQNQDDIVRDLDVLSLSNVQLFNDHVLLIFLALFCDLHCSLNKV